MLILLDSKWSNIVNILVELKIVEKKKENKDRNKIVSNKV
jgi:hypothetical protein